MASAERSYLDYNASAPLRPEAAEAVVAALRLPGNPSSIHAEGRAARALIERAREQVGALVGASPAGVIFTSGGTEASNAVLSPSLRRAGEEGLARLLIGATEHPCGLEGHRFSPEQAIRIPVDGAGLVDLAWLGERLSSGPRALVSVQAANNETGVVQPVPEIAQLVHKHGGLLHSDAVQGAGKVSLDLAALGADVVTLSAHKLGGPKGVGAIVLASDRVEIGERLVRGGGQERGRRSGTENVPAIAGFGVAAALAGQEIERERARLAGLRDALEAELARIAPDLVVFGRDAQRLPNTSAFAVPGLKAETALMTLDLAGVAVSSGSACSSGKVRRSHVLEAMGVEPNLAAGAIRVSLGWETTENDLKRFTVAFEKLAGHLYEQRASAA